VAKWVDGEVADTPTGSLSCHTPLNRIRGYTAAVCGLGYHFSLGGIPTKLLYHTLKRNASVFSYWQNSGCVL